MSATLSIAKIGEPGLRESEPLEGNYFVAVYPPFSAWKASQCRNLQEALGRPAPEGAPLGIYVHVPFCQKKCDFCYYLSFIRQPASVVDRYLDCMVDEMARYAGQPAVEGREVAFVYFGGGTPSTLSRDQISRLGRGMHGALAWAGQPEVTFECAPRSVGRRFLDGLRELGVTRLSMGVQSFDDSLLKLNGRVHLVEDVLRARQLIRDAAFGWLNLDLMVGLMGETWESWENSVRRMIELDPESVTIYQTEIPHNTQLYRDFKDGNLPAEPVSWEVKRERLKYAFEALRNAGYTTVNGYAAVKDPEAHRFVYQDHLWRGGDMLGLGVASFGYLGGVHYQNHVTLDAYQSAVESGELPINRALALGERDQLIREFILQLKFGEVSVPAFQSKFGIDIAGILRRPLEGLVAEGFATVSKSRIQLTPDGLLRVDRLLPRFFDRAYQNTRYT